MDLVDQGQHALRVDAELVFGVDQRQTGLRRTLLTMGDQCERNLTALMPKIAVDEAVFDHIGGGDRLVVVAGFGFGCRGDESWLTVACFQLPNCMACSRA